MLWAVAGVAALRIVEFPLGLFFPFLLKITHVCSQIDLSSSPVDPRSPTAFLKFAPSLSPLVKLAVSVSVSIIPFLLLASAEMADFRFSFVFTVSLSNDFPTASLVLSQEHAFLFFCNMNRSEKFSNLQAMVPFCLTISPVYLSPHIFL